MPWCQVCGAKNLKPEEVHFDEINQRFGHQECISKPAVVELMVPVKYRLGVDEKGVHAEVAYGGLKLSIDAPQEDLKKLFGG